MVALINGIAYPLTVSNGGLAVAIDTELVRQQIFSILETCRNERVMRPDYGLPDQLFSPIVPGAIGAYIQRILQEEIPAANFVVGSTASNNGTLEVEVRWSVSGVVQPAIGYELA
jgi:hypothetical protein